MNKKTKLLALVLTLVMLISGVAILPASAEATPGVTVEETDSTKTEGAKTTKYGDIPAKYANASEYPFAVFTSTTDSEGNVKYTFKNAFKLFYGDASNAAYAATTGSTRFYTGAMAYTFMILPSDSPVILFRSDYTIKNKTTPVSLDEYYIANSLTEKGYGYLENGKLVTPTLAEGSTTRYKYNCGWDLGDSNMGKCASPITVDLNGYTFDMAEQGINLQLRNKLGAGKCTFTYANGNIINVNQIFGSVAHQTVVKEAGTRMSFNLNFENINLALSKNPNAIVTHAQNGGLKSGSATDYYPDIDVNVEFISSTLDLSACASTYKAFRTSTTGGSINVNFDGGCKIISANNRFNETNLMAYGTDARGTCTFNGGNAALIEYSTTLGEEFGINFYAKLPQNAASVEITVEDEEPIVTAIDKVVFGELCKFSAKVSSIDTRKNVTVKFFDKNGDVLNLTTATDNSAKAEYTTSVYKYAQYLVADETQSDDVKAAAAALIDYAAFAEKYFVEKADGEFNISEVFADANIAAVEGVDASKITGVLNASAVSDKLGTAQLVLDSATKIMIKITGAYESFVGADNIKIVGSYVEISEIIATDLDNPYSFTLDNVTYNVSVLGIASVVANDTTGAYSENFVNLMKALYRFSAACEELTPAA